MTARTLTAHRLAVLKTFRGADPAHGNPPPYMGFGGRARSATRALVELGLLEAMPKMGRLASTTYRLTPAGSVAANSGKAA